MFKERTAIVTGGSRGIGFAIAKEFSTQGAAVIICSRTESQLNEAVGQLASDGSKAFGITADVSRFEDCQKLIDLALSMTGRIDILVNNAGIYGPVGLLETNSPKDWSEVLAINVLGAVYCCILVIPYMKKQGSGKIINLAGGGVGGPKSLPRFSGYYTSKAAIVSLTESLAVELQGENIQVNAISPGPVASDLNLNLLRLDKSVVGEEMYDLAIQLKKEGGTLPDLAVKLVAFLVSKDADHISGCLLSAKWDFIEDLKRTGHVGQNLYRLRRIDNKNFLEGKKE